MATLKELIDEHGLGVRVCRNGWGDRDWFEPKLISPYKTDVLGFENEGKAEVWSLDSTDWSLYIEPKKKIQKFLWAFKEVEGEWVTGSVFRTDEEAAKTFGEREAIKLEHTMIEVSE